MEVDGKTKQKRRKKREKKRRENNLWEREIRKDEHQNINDDNKCLLPSSLNARLPIALEADWVTTISSLLKKGEEKGGEVRVEDVWGVEKSEKGKEDK